MALLLSPEQELIKKVVREFAQQDLAPAAAAIDREERFARAHVEKMAPLGLLGMLLPTEAGGAGTDTLSFVVGVEEVARVSGSDAAFLVLQNALVVPLLHAHGSEEQQASVLEPVLKGKRLAACALAEESGGSQMEAVRARLGRAKDGWTLRGAKSFVSLGGVADDYLVLARSRAGPTLVHVPRDAKELFFSSPESKLGLRGLPLADMFLNDVHVPAHAVVGAEGKALDALVEPLDLARLGVASALVGLTQGALDMALEFAKTRVQFGQPIAKFGAIRGMLADVQADLDAARATTYGAAALRDSQKTYRGEVLEARLLAHRIAVRGTKIAHKIHGGAGFMRDLPLERMSRDVRTLMHLWDAQDLTRAKLADLMLG